MSHDGAAHMYDNNPAKTIADLNEIEAELLQYLESLNGHLKHIQAKKKEMMHEQAKEEGEKVSATNVDDV